jgi:hypothetical protein
VGCLNQSVGGRNERYAILDFGLGILDWGMGFMMPFQPLVLPPLQGC